MFSSRRQPNSSFQASQTHSRRMGSRGFVHRLTRRLWAHRAGSTRKFGSLILLPVFIAGPVIGMATAAYAASSPVVDAVIPNHGTAAGGDNVLIKGSGFTGATAVAFGSTTLPPCPATVACFHVNGDRGIDASSPPGTAGAAVDVRVTVGAVTSAINTYDKFTYDPQGPPVVSGVSPRSGPATGGTGGQILGSGFTGATGVAFGSATLPPCGTQPCFTVSGDTFIGANSPAGSGGTVDVTVTVGATTSATGNADKFTYTSRSGALQAPPKSPAPRSPAAQSAPSSPGPRHPATQPHTAPVLGAVAPSAMTQGTQSLGTDPQARSKSAIASAGGRGTAWSVDEWIRFFLALLMR